MRYSVHAVVRRAGGQLDEPIIGDYDVDGGAALIEFTRWDDHLRDADEIGTGFRSFGPQRYQIRPWAVDRIELHVETDSR